MKVGSAGRACYERSQRLLHKLAVNIFLKECLFLLALIADHFVSSCFLVNEVNYLFVVSFSSLLN